MEHLKAKFQITTPMFISGNDQTKAELRPTAIKGALRFWWRTLQTDLTLDELKVEEGKLFGSTEQQATHHIYLSDVKVNDENQENWDTNDWESYVGYGLIENNRDYLESSGSFTLNIVTSESVNDSVKNAVIAFGLLGGLGGRSRKGWGSVTLNEFNDWTAPNDKSNLENAITELGLSSNPDLPKYSAFSHQARVVCGQFFDNTTLAHQNISTLYKNVVKGIENKPDREEFGLPRLMGDIDRTDERRASPLFLHVHAFPNGKAMPVCTFLPAHFLEDQKLPITEYKHIKSFLDQVNP